MDTKACVIEETMRVNEWLVRFDVNSSGDRWSNSHWVMGEKWLV